jgi:hypothetical protein
MAQFLRRVVNAFRLLAELAREAFLGRHQTAEDIEGHAIGWRMNPAGMEVTLARAAAGRRRKEP